MPRVRLLGPHDAVLGDVESVEGERLLDLCDEHGLALAFSCRGATCGICRVEVVDGLDKLLPPSDDELRTLAALGASSRRRLACQVRLAPGPGLVVLRRADAR